MRQHDQEGEQADDEVRVKEGGDASASTQAESGTVNVGQVVRVVLVCPQPGVRCSSVAPAVPPSETRSRSSLKY